MIRLARDSDHDAVWPLLRDAFRAGDTYAVDPQIGKQAALDYWITSARAAYVATGPEGLTGTYYIKTNHAGNGAHICNCGYIVAAAARGQGIAAQMCAHSQSEARQLGYKAMQFNLVLASNAPAVHLWQRMGFATLGTIPAAFDHPALGMVDAFVMHKTL